jgi:hypothetical protein
MCPQVQPTDDEAKEPLPEATRLAGEASLNPVDDGVSVPCLSGSTMGPSELAVPALSSFAVGYT